MDQLAYGNRFVKFHPLEKVIIAMATMIFVLLWDKPIYQGIILIIMSLLTIFGAGIPIKIYLKYMTIPIAFIIMTIIPILLEVHIDRSIFLHSVSFLQGFIGITEEGIITSVSLLFRSLSALTCLYFLTMTTPMQDIISLLQKAHCPAAFTELMVLTYRFIFVFLNTSKTIYMAQSSRLGYNGFYMSLKSLGTLSSVLFIKSYMQARALYRASLSRGYVGTFYSIENERKINIKRLLCIGMIETLLFLLGGSL